MKRQVKKQTGENDKSDIIHIKSLEEERKWGI